MKAGFPNSRECIVEKENENKDEEEKDCSLDNKISKLTIVKIGKNEHLKGSTKSN